MTEFMDIERLLKLLRLNTTENHHQENVVILTMLSGDHQLMLDIIDVWASWRFRGIYEDTQEDFGWSDRREEIASKAWELIEKKFGKELTKRVFLCF
jgi:hypothetical protein